MNGEYSVNRRTGEPESRRLCCVKSILVLCLLSFTFCASLITVSQAELIDRVVAYVNDRAITLSELREMYERTKKIQPDISMEEVLNTTVNRLLLLSDARRLKIEAKTDEETLSEYTELKVRAFIRVREEEIEDYYKKNEKEFAGAAYESVRDKIEEYLTEKEINRLLKVQIAELRAKAYVKILLNFAGDKDTVILGTATQGGGFPAYGDALAETVNQTDPSLHVRPRNTKGSTENVPLLQAGQLDIALVQGEVVHDVFSRGGSAVNLKIIVAMYATPGMFVVRADSPYHDIRDLIGQPVAFGARGSGLVILARYVLSGIDLDQDRDFNAIYLDNAGDGPVMVQDGRVSALWGGGIGWPGFDAVAKLPGGARFIAPNADEINLIVAKHPFLRRLTIPKGSYPGQDSPIPSVGSWSFVLARPTLPDDVAYRLVRALHRGEQVLGSLLPQARETTMTNTLAVVQSPDLIHPGVLRYFREIGLIP